MPPCFHAAIMQLKSSQNIQFCLHICSCFSAFLLHFIVLVSSSTSSSSLEYDIPVFEKSGKGGTYPRRYGIPFGLQDYSDGTSFFTQTTWLCVSLHFSCTIHSILILCSGRKTFPRARRTQVHGFRSPVSFSPTEQSPSTSSGSSVFTPDLEEAPGPARRPRRGSDIEPNPNPTVAPTLSVMDISPPSRCEFDFIAEYDRCTKHLGCFFFLQWFDCIILWCLYEQLHALQPTGGSESSWVRGPLDGFSSVMMQILAGNWQSNRSSLTRRVRRPARWESALQVLRYVGMCMMS